MALHVRELEFRAPLLLQMARGVGRVTGWGGEWAWRTQVHCGDGCGVSWVTMS